MNWLNNIPDVSIKKIALILTRIDFKNLNNGLLKLSFDQDVINSFFIDLTGSTEYIEEVRTILSKDTLEVHINLNLKGVYYSTHYLITLKSFVFHPGKHQVILNYNRKGKRSPLVEKIYDLTIKPYIINKLKSFGVKVNEPFLEIDLNNIESIKDFKDSFIGTIIFSNLNVRMLEFSDKFISFEIDVSTFKETFGIIKDSIQTALVEKAKNKASA